MWNKERCGSACAGGKGCYRGTEESGHQRWVGTAKVQRVKGGEAVPTGASDALGGGKDEGEHP